MRRFVDPRLWQLITIALNKFKFHHHLRICRHWSVSVNIIYLPESQTLRKLPKTHKTFKNASNYPPSPIRGSSQNTESRIHTADPYSEIFWEMSAFQIVCHLGPSPIASPHQGAILPVRRASRAARTPVSKTWTAWPWTTTTKMARAGFTRRSRISTWRNHGMSATNTCSPTDATLHHRPVSHYLNLKRWMLRFY